jgi:ectoine hydroxylase-related dioxygenase (phytanoyl-CoA dioxygenase family)
MEASNFHKDCDDADSVAAYIYLVDTIADTSGAFVYVPGSNRYDPRSCSPRLSRDLGVNSNDGRMSDEEVEKYYPKDTWISVREKRGSVVLFHGNGIHKGPSWAQYGDPRNEPRTAIRLAFGGFKVSKGGRPSRVRVRKEEHQKLSKLQQLFVK